MHVRKTTNLEVIERLDTKIFGKEKLDESYETAIWWLAYVDGKIAGYAGLRVFCEGDRERSGFLTRAGVLKEFRGLGIQRALIDCRDREARRQGLNMNITYTADWNTASANNLIRCGYELYIPQYKFGLKNALYFWKKFKYRSK